jgi:hypothetical protein
VIALTAGIASRADMSTEKGLSLPSGAIIVAANDAELAQGQPEESAEDSAEMGKEEGTHEGADLGEAPESDTKKIDQPERGSPDSTAAD